MPRRGKVGGTPGKRLHNRMFNNSKHIGHNKFGVIVSKTGQPLAVLTGSTNWTPTGLCGQTNNAILIEDEKIAAEYLAYWQRLKDDKIPEPVPLSTPNSADQGVGLRTANHEAAEHGLKGHSDAGVSYGSRQTRQRRPCRATIRRHHWTWRVFALMHGAKALLFLSFYPAQQGRNSIIGGRSRSRGTQDLFILGAISAPQAMPNYAPPEKKEDMEGARPRTGWILRPRSTG
jgi:hypothetical protein